MRDPEFREQAQKISLDVDPYSDAEIAKFVDSVENAPLDLIDRIAKLIAVPN